MKVDGATDIDARSDATYRRRAMPWPCAR